MLCRSRLLVILLLSAVAAVAQWRPQDPINAAIQDCYRLRGEGNYDAAVAKREEARALFDRSPVDAPQFVTWLNGVSQMYEQAGKTAEVRSILEAALARGNRLPDAHPMRAMLLNMLAGNWQRDGSLLKAAAYLEQAMAVVDAVPVAAYRSGPRPDATYIYQQLANLYRQLGRPEAADAVVAKVQARLRSNPSALASFYMQQGQLDEAEAVYKQLSDQARNPQDAINALQSLANVYQQEGRADDAVTTLQHAIAVAQGAGAGQASWLRQQVAGWLQQAGRNDQADQTYQQLLSDPEADQYQAVTSYVRYLSSTKRAGQGAKLLTDYLASHSDLNPGQEASALDFLAMIAGDPKRAEEFRRAAAEKWPRPLTLAPNSIGEDIGAAETAASEGRLDDAYSLCLHAIDAAPMARDRDLIATWGLRQVANTIANKDPAKATEMYQRVLAAAEGWSADTIQPLSQASEAYIRFLMGQADPRETVRTAIERYGSVIASAHGADAGARAILNLTIDSARFPNSLDRAIFPAEERLRLEESLSGTTSQPYLNALRTLAELYGATADRAQALPLHRQMVAIADLTATRNDPQPALSRMNAALAFASQRQFDEAERLASEAVAMAKSLRSSWLNQFTQQLDQIRWIEKTAQ
jgi:tetratricopeptide (TPR) repeat protein